MADSSNEREHDDAARVRSVLSRELETISHYEAMATRATLPGVRDFFLHLASEEKEHVAEAVAVLRSLDLAQNAHFERDLSEHLGVAAPAKATVSAPAHAPGHPPTVGREAAVDPDLRLPHHPEKVVHALPYAPSPAAGTFTVGPLKTRR